MLERPSRDRVRGAWLAVGLWVLFIFATAPLARSLQAFVAAHWGRSAFALGVGGLVAASALAAGLQASRRRSLTRTGALWLGGVAALFIGFTITLRAAPEEAIHFVEYGILGVLAFRALRHRLSDASVYAAAAAVAALAGIVDEALQWATPERIWDLRDIGRNCLAAALVQLAIAAGLRPEGISPRPSSRGLLLLCRLGMGGVLLLGASLLNTPERIGWTASRVPALAYLAHKASPMFEYGYLHEDSQIGRFRSRFTIPQLRELDVARGDEAGRTLARSGDDASYASFLQRYTPVTDPFLHELRVHLYSRDYHVRAEREAGGDAERQRMHASIAYRENRILETYFPQTLRRSGRSLAPAARRELAALNLSDLQWESWVSRDLATRIEERHVVGALGLALVVLAILQRRLARAERGR